MPYATAVDMQSRYDWREIGDLISDSDEQISADDQLITTAGTAGGRLNDVLTDASGDVDTALLVAGRYATTDLTGLTGSSLNYLKRIVCRIAMCYLMERKPLFKPEVVEQYRKWTDKYLKQLQDGVNVFNLPGQVSAGTPEAAGLSTVQYDVNNLNLATDPARMHYYPNRQLPFGRGGPGF